MQVDNKAKHLGVMARNKGVTAENSMKSTPSAIQKTNLLPVAGIHEGKTPQTTMLTIHETFVQPLAIYAIHLTPESREVQESWDKLEKEITKRAFGIYWERSRVRLRNIAKLNTLNEAKVLIMTAMTRGLRNRSETPLPNRQASRDNGMLVATRATLKCKEEVNRGDVDKH